VVVTLEALGVWEGRPNHSSVPSPSYHSDFHKVDRYRYQ
jgi:hypothetical protein